MFLCSLACFGTVLSVPSRREFQRRIRADKGHYTWNGPRWQFQQGLGREGIPEGQSSAPHNSVVPLLPPSLVNFTGLSPLLLFQENCAGCSGLIPQIIYPHCTTPPIFCFLKQKNLLAASELSGAVILNANVKSKRRQRAPADLQPPPT